MRRMLLSEDGAARGMGRILTLLGISALVVCSGFALRMSWEALGKPEPAYAQSRNQGCPGPRS
jgi:hypothetical protein